jgi:predicted RNA binding protein YcfA (HicA-like mRNA interferase family)
MGSEERIATIKKRLEKAGYRLARVSGSHHIFEKPGQTLLSIPVHRGKVKRYYVRQVERIIEAEKPEGEGEEA